MSQPLPATAPSAACTVSVRPVILPAPGRGEDLQLRVSTPMTGGGLPLVVFSHGFGFSMDGYGPLADYWAANGFAVIQPTHLDSATLALAPDDPRTSRIWRCRVEDLVRVLNGLDLIEASVPGLTGRIDRARIAAAGHSYGATTASALLGARVLGPQSHDGEDFSDPRVRAGVLLSVPGTGGENLTPFAAQFFPFMNPDFAAMTCPALIVAGDNDQSPLTTRGPDWFTDAYTLSPGVKNLLTVVGAEHALGGVHAYGGMSMTAAENLAQVAFVQQVTTTYLRSALGGGDEDWTTVGASLSGGGNPLGRLQSR